MAEGQAVSPRAIRTREVFPGSFELRNPRARVLLAHGRYINPAFAIAEALWILSGTHDPWIFDYNSNLKQFANDGILRGAYGPRIRSWAGHIDQLKRARDILMKDRESRRAIVQIYDPASVQEDDLDVPCTITHHFLIRNGCLHLFTTMRGQDVWLGLPYDVFYNTFLQELMAGWLDVDLGSYFYRADSLHIYERDLQNAQSIRIDSPSANAAMSPVRLEWDERDRVILSVLNGCIAADHSLAPLSKILESYRQWRRGSYLTAPHVAALLDGPLGEACRRWYAHLSSRTKQSGVGL